MSSLRCAAARLDAGRRGRRTSRQHHHRSLTITGSCTTRRATRTPRSIHQERRVRSRSQMASTTWDRSSTADQVTTQSTSILAALESAILLAEGSTRISEMWRRSFTDLSRLLISRRRAPPCKRKAEVFHRGHSTPLRGDAAISNSNSHRSSVRFRHVGLDDQLVSVVGGRSQPPTAAQPIRRSS